MRKLGTILACLFALGTTFAVYAHSENAPWVRLADLPQAQAKPGGSVDLAPGTFGACVDDDEDGHYVFAIYGHDGALGADTRSVRAYDIETNRWSFRSDAPGPARRYPAGAFHNGEIYCAGGGSDTAVFADAYRYDAWYRRWTTLKPMPEGRLGAGAAGYPGRGFYVLGGATSPAMCDAPSSGVMRFDDATQSWQQAGQLTTPRAGAPAARVGRYIYLFGGCSDSGMLDTVERYDPATNTSKLLPVTMPGGARIRAAVTEHDDTIHLTGGVDAFGLEVLPNHIVFDPATGRFTVETPLPIDEYCFHGDGLSGHGMAEHENHIYVVGGTCDDSFDGVARVYGLDHD